MEVTVRLVKEIQGLPVFPTLSALSGCMSDRGFALHDDVEKASLKLARQVQAQAWSTADFLLFHKQLVAATLPLVYARNPKPNVFLVVHSLKKISTLLHAELFDSEDLLWTTRGRVVQDAKRVGVLESLASDCFLSVLCDNLKAMHAKTPLAIAMIMRKGDPYDGITDAVMTPNTQAVMTVVTARVISLLIRVV